MVGIVSRFVEDKGFDLIEEIASDLARLPLILAVLGTGDKKYQDMFPEAEPRVSGKICRESGL